MDNITKYNDRIFEKNIKIISKLKKSKFKYYEYDFSNESLLSNDNLNHIVKILNKKKLKLHDLNNIRGNYRKGVLPFLLILCHYAYFYNYIENSFFKFDILYRNSEFYVTRYDDNLFISFRGTTIYSQIEYFHDLTFYKKNIDYINKYYFNKFLKWKEKILKNYPIEKILSRKIISNIFRFHGGFVDLYNAYKIFPKVKNILLNNKKFKNIIITGHSMGASFTNLLILDLFNFSIESKKKININAVTFGAPGCMNSNLSLFYYYLSSIDFIKKYIRIYNENDIISSTFSDQDDYFTSLFGLLRHVDSAVLNNNKSKIEKYNYDFSKKFIFFNTENNVKNFTKGRFNSHEIHNLFCFTKSKDGILFSL